MKPLSIVLATLLVALQYPLWLGKGSWTRAWDLERQVEAQQAGLARMKARNDALEAEVRDLKQGYEAIEERARLELGMIKPDEILVQLSTPRR